MDIEIFADETKVTDNNSGKEYLGIGCLFVPISKKEELSKELSNKRCLNEENEEWFWDDKKCPTKCSYHKDNNTEIHHKDLSKHAKFSKRLISKGWLEFLNCNNHENKELVYFNILYLDLEKIDLENFGDDKTMVYNRFF